MIGLFILIKNKQKNARNVKALEGLSSKFKSISSYIIFNTNSNDHRRWFFVSLVHASVSVCPWITRLTCGLQEHSF